MQEQTQSQGKWEWPHAPIEVPDPSASPDFPNAPAANDERIQVEAYRIAEQRGFPENQALDHWLEAEKQVSQKGSESERF